MITPRIKVTLIVISNMIQGLAIGALLNSLGGQLGFNVVIVLLLMGLALANANAIIRLLVEDHNSHTKSKM